MLLCLFALHKSPDILLNVLFRHAASLSFIKVEIEISPKKRRFEFFLFFLLWCQFSCLTSPIFLFQIVHQMRVEAHRNRIISRLKFLIWRSSNREREFKVLFSLLFEFNKAYITISDT